MGKMRLPFIDNGLLYRGADLTANDTTVVEITTSVLFINGSTATTG
jgi:hypothetical protein